MGEDFSIGAELWTHQHSFENGGAVFEERGHYHAAAPKDGAFLLKTAPLQGEERDRGPVFDWFDLNEQIRVD